MKTVGVKNCGACLLSGETDDDFLRNLSRSFPKQGMEELVNMETTGTSLTRKIAALLETPGVLSEI
jgi:hypothetical protein